MTNNTLEFSSVVENKSVRLQSYETALKNCAQSVDIIYGSTKKLHMIITRENAAPRMNNDFMSNLAKVDQSMENIKSQLKQAKHLKQRIIRAVPGLSFEILITCFKDLVMKINLDLNESQKFFFDSELSFAYKFTENISDSARR